MEYHVKKTGNDMQKGTLEAPFKTISKAAAIALPGDTVTVHAGVYREWVNPKNGGSVHARIVYQAAEGEDVTITGAEVITDWKESDGVWKTVIPNSFFGDFNPYAEIIQGDWFFVRGREFHMGEVYLNGKSMYEAENLDGVKNPVETKDSHDKPGSLYTWYCETDNDNTTIWANFHGADPRGGNVEINVRPFVFWPEQTGRGYITVRGFKLRCAATQWAPPTALQTGLIGPHWSREWIIENNEISDSKNSGISLGKEISTGHNEWTRLGFKQGTQREREVIFRATHGNWQKENVGGHIIRNNIIRDCEQTAIVGHLGAAFCTIEHNHIYRIHYKRQYHGAEVGGIKFHAALDTQIVGNFIHDCHRAIWLDWQAQGTRLSRNVLYNNFSEDLMVEVCHGPYTLDHNIMLSPWAFKDMSQGAAFVHNLIRGKFASCPENTRYTPYHFPHETDVFGVSNIQSGDDRFYNNIFLRDPGDNDDPVQSSFWDGAPTMDGLPGSTTFLNTPVGTGQYNEHPGPEDVPFWEMMRTRTRPVVPPTPPPAADGTPPAPPPMPRRRMEPKLKVVSANNLYLNGAKACSKEIGATEYEDSGISFEIADAAAGKILIHVKNPAQLDTGKCKVVTTDILGTSFHAEMKYEQPDGSPFVFDTDFFGAKRTKVIPGPFEVTDTVTYEVSY